MPPARPVDPSPVLPAYGGACLDSLVPALLAEPGARPAWLPEPLADAAQVVLLVLDGLGWGQLDTRRHLAPTLAGMVGGPITSVVPTTTATALSSIALGCAPAVHGTVGYRLRVEGPSGDEVLNVLRWRTNSGDARAFLPPATFQARRAFEGRPVPVVSKLEFAGTGFSDAHLGGARLVGWSLPSGLAVEVRRLLAAGERFVYAYYDGIDKVAHGSGFGDLYDAEIVATDRLVDDVAAVLPPGAALAVTADHGQVEVGTNIRPLVEAVTADTFLVSGEARFRWLHARPGRIDAVLQAAQEAYGSEAWVLTAADMERRGWFGGALEPAVRHRLGDVAVVPHQPVAYLDPADMGDVRLVCRHGSVTSDEMLVPLLALTT